MVGAWALTSGVRIVLVFIGMLIGMKVASILSRRVLGLFGKHVDDLEMRKRADTLKSVVQYLLSTVIVAVAAMMILGELGVEIGPVLAAAGVVGLAVGFGAQNLVQDVIGGFFILLEDQIRVGDVVEVGGKGGLVERVNLRMTILRDLAGNVHYVRNGQIGIVTNMTKEFSRYVFDIGVAYREDVDEVMDVIRAIDEELRADAEFGGDIIAPIEILGLDEFGDSAIIIKARTTTRPIQQWRIGREFNRRLKKRFDELDIEIPFPHVTLYAGQAKDGSSAPLNVALRERGEPRGGGGDGDGEAASAQHAAAD
jgi:small conductance mechanosensitive channel